MAYPDAPSPAVDADPPGEDALEAAWARVLARWDDDEAHARFRALAVTLGQLPEAGRRYRAVRDGDEDAARREDASRHIDALLATAMTTLEASRDPLPDPHRTRRGLFLVATGLTVALLLGALFLWLR